MYLHRRTECSEFRDVHIVLLTLSVRIYNIIVSILISDRLLFGIAPVLYIVYDNSAGGCFKFRQKYNMIAQPKTVCLYYNIAMCRATHKT